MLITNAAIKNRTTVAVLILFIICAGTWSYLSLPRETFPEVSIPNILVSTAYESASPAVVEKFVTKKLEDELSGIKGLKEMRSQSAEGLSLINLEFYPNVVIEDALQYVRDRVNRAKAELPDTEDRKEPIIKEIDVSEFPIMMINISGIISGVRLKSIADRLEDELEKVPGVLECDVHGALEREIRVEFDPDRLAAYQLTIAEIMDVVPAQNVNISAGGLETAGMKFNVRVPAEFGEPKDVQMLPLAVRDGRLIHLTDIARIRDTFKDRQTYARLNGSETITVAVKKRTGANIIPIVKKARAIVEHFRARAPKGVAFEITLDQSRHIRMMLSDLENNILTGFILVAGVLLLFMGWRTSIIVALAIPMSMLISFLVIDAIGYTLNMMILVGLIMVLGMLVDNAIVIVENIYRHMQMGYSRMQAAMMGTKEVGWPVITSTATTLAAFGPMMFWPGTMGSFMRIVPITLTITLSSSLFVAMVVSPTVCSVASGGIKKKQDNEHHPFVSGYRRVLGWALSHKRLTLSASVAMLLAMFLIYGLYNHGQELFPQLDPTRGVINIRAPQGTSIQQSDSLAREVERRIQPRHAEYELEYVISNAGSSGGGEATFGGMVGGPHFSNVTLLFEDYEDRKKLSADAIVAIRRSLADIPGAEIKVEKEREGPPTGEAITVQIIGEDFRQLERISRRARDLIKNANVRGLVNLRSDHEAATPELPFQVDRARTLLTGVSARRIGHFLKTNIFGTKVGTYRQFNDEHDITLRLPQSQRINIEDTLRLRVPNPRGTPVPISSVGYFSYAGGMGTIRRIDQKRVITLTAGAEGRLSTEVLKDVQNALAGLKGELDPGYEIRYAGEEEERQKAKAFLKKAYVVALFLIVMILVTQFNTLSVPLIIMATVLLSLFGVFGGLLVHAMPFSIIMTGMGVISLAGVVVNNAIVLLDYTRRLQRKGMQLVQAAIQAGATRLRPVLLTATTTILGLLPMATGVSFDFHQMQIAWKSESSQWWASMAVAIIYGLLFATLLTLIVVPVLYVWLYGLTAKLGFGGLRKVGAEQEPKTAPVSQES